MEPSPTLLAEPLVQAQPELRRRVGRPKGSKGRVTQGARVLGAHHFAFVRESLLGLDLAEAFHRYLAWSETTTDVRHVQHRSDGLLEHIIDEVKNCRICLTYFLSIWPNTICEPR